MITRDDIRELFGDLLAEITDPALADKVVDAWVEGCRLGGWDSVEKLRTMPFTLLTPTHGIDFVQHTRAVTHGALALGRAMAAHQDLPYEIDFDILVAGGLVHDLGKLMEIEPDGMGGFRKSHAGRCLRHPISGAALAARFGFPDEILNVIANHSKEGDGRPQRPETVLVHQADFATFNPIVMLNKGTLITEKAAAPGDA